MRSTMQRSTWMLASIVIIGLFAGMSPGQSKPLRWDQQRIQDYPVYHLLLKARSVGAGMSERLQWERAKEKGDKFHDHKREENLRKLLKDHPRSDYVDDAALLLARCRFLYHQDANGAINGLYAVIQRYPKAAKSTWLAEDRLFLEHAMLSNVTKQGHPRKGWYGSMPSQAQVEAMPEGKGPEDGERALGQMWKELAYFEYWSASPNWTEDEARCWIAWIIVKADLAERMAEAEQVLRQVIESRRPELRTRADSEAAGKVEYGEGITKYMDRTERKAHLFLIDLLLKQGKLDAAKTAASDYAKLHAGHTSVDVLAKKGLLENSKGEN